MNRTIQAIITTGAGLALVLGMTSPADAATSERINEARGDVFSNDTTGLTRAEKKIDMHGKILLRTVADGRKDLVAVRVKGKDFRRAGNQFMFLFTQKPNGAQSYVLANMDGSTARVSDYFGGDAEKCRGGGVRANLKRDIATLRMPSRCLGGGDRVRISNTGTLISRSRSFEQVSAVDERDGGDPSIVLNYR